MKAQFVYENINFERGLDPKSSMGIGAKEFLRKQLEEVSDHLSGAYKNDIPKVLDFLLNKNANIEFLGYDSEDLAEVKWVSSNGQRRRSRMGYPEYDETTVQTPKRKWYGKKYYKEELANRGPFIALVDWIKWSEKHLWSKNSYYKGVLDREIINEYQDFERGKDPKKSMDIGITIQNRDFRKREKNFMAAHPEIQHAHSASIFTVGSGIGGHDWETISFSKQTLDPIKDFKPLDVENQRYKEWFEKYTDFDIIEIRSYGRTWHPWGDEKKSLITEYSFEVKLRNEGDVS